MVDMRQIYACVDQLDLAVQQLKDAGPYSSRIALILTDNAVELMLYRRCEEYSLERYYSGDRLADKEAKALGKALGRRFEEKPKFCCSKLSVISELERDFILTAHKYRSEAYHQGILHEDILHALAWEYHELGCQLFGHFPPRSMTVRFDDELTPAVRRHFGERGIDFIGNKAGSFEEAARSLSQARPTRAEELRVVLSRSAVKQVDELQDNLTFIASNHPDALDEEQVIERLQFHKHVFGRHSGIAGLGVIKEPPELAARLQLIHAAWTPKIKRNPCPRWKDRALALAEETDSAMALRKYESLRRQVNSFAGMAAEAARSLSHAIELAGDLRRDMGL
jgi:hypothetical protein